MQPAVHGNGAAGDVRSAWTGEKHREIRHLFRITDTAHRNSRSDLIADVLHAHSGFLRAIGEQLRLPPCADVSRRDVVDRDTEARDLVR